MIVDSPAHPGLAAARITHDARMTKRKHHPLVLWLTDFELIRTELEIDNPYAQDGLVDKMPDGAHIVRIVNVYRYRLYPADRARCAQCGAKKHKHGFTVRLNTGALLLFGRCCGEAVLKDKWKAVDDSLEEQRDRKYYLLSLDRIKDHAARAIVMLNSWEKLARAIRASRYELRSVLAGAYEVLEQAAARGGELRVSRKLRAYNWRSDKGRKDDEPADEMADGKREGYETRYVTETAHHIIGKEFLRRGNPVLIPERATALMRKLLATLAHSDDYLTSRLKALDMQIKSAAQELRTLDGMRSAAIAFYTAANGSGIANWIASVEQSTDPQFGVLVTADGPHLINMSTGNRAGPPAAWPEPDRRVLDLLSGREEREEKQVETA